MFDQQFREMMPHTLYYEPPATYDVTGKVSTYGTKKGPYPCRISGKILTIRSKTSNDMTEVFDIWAYTGTDALSPLGRFTLPTDARFGVTTPEVFAVAVVTDEDGHHHHKIQCGWRYHRQGQ